MEQSGLKHKMRKNERLRRRACRLKAFAHAKEDALTGTLGGIGIAYGAAGSPFFPQFSSEGRGC